MSDEQNQFTPPPPPGPGVSGSSQPHLGAAMPPPPPPMAMPVMMPAPMPKKSFASRVKDALVLLIFFGSIVLNILLLITLVGALAGQQVDTQVRETVLLRGAADQQIAVIEECQRQNKHIYGRKRSR